VARAITGNDLHPNTDTLPYRGTFAGGGYSTVEDLLKFANALEDHKLLNAALDHQCAYRTGPLQSSPYSCSPLAMLRIIQN
jgi:hypothetical protein